MSEEQKCTCPLCGANIEHHYNGSTLNHNFKCSNISCATIFLIVGCDLAEARARFMQRPESVEAKMWKELKAGFLKTGHMAEYILMEELEKAFKMQIEKELKG